MSNKMGYTLVKEATSENERNKMMMKLAQKELSKEENRKRMGIVNSEIRDLKRSGRLKHISEFGATKVVKKGKEYYMYPNMLVEVTKGDSTFRVVYLVSPNKDTIKLAKEKCRALGLINGTQRNIVNVYLDSMNLQGK